MVTLEEYFKWHLKAFASELFIYIYNSFCNFICFDVFPRFKKIYISKYFYLFYYDKTMMTKIIDWPSIEHLRSITFANTSNIMLYTYLFYPFLTVYQFLPHTHSLVSRQSRVI